MGFIDWLADKVQASTGEKERRELVQTIKNLAVEFKEKVYQARMQLGLTQMELARQLGIGYATINRWENGITKPTKLKEYAFTQFCAKNAVVIDDAYEENKR